MRRIDGDHGLSVRLSSLERLLELRETRSRLPGRPLPPSSLEQHSRLRPTERLGIVEQRVALLEPAAQTLDPRKLRQDLGPARIRRLQLELRPEATFGRVEVVEVPQGTKPVAHCDRP